MQYIMDTILFDKSQMTKKVESQMSNVNLLTPYVFWSVALLGMNSVYANDTSILEIIINEETVNHEDTPTSQTATEKQELPSKIEANHVATGSIDILEDPEATEDSQQENPPKKQRKTHYGIGYEFRNALRKAAKKQQTEYVERTETTQNIERAEKAQRPERIKRPERVERPARVTRPERHNR
ncbi:MAG: Unknown protein [uncultured Thiotrichaceae bacterium]|uniref:Uncharacterized protein n=1 Tax=uncultured Thiotrichaceae bacterium TaxID=298394 RepID=A0A6S6TZ92_9GAMM|nr:MAG: Unknown protein [uncultured Thiotrichaceae bacterium]